ncbi:MAG: hypothetical protein CV087_22705 [Candidatus Brocadia sp. WS118]|nr:MAG: hypothetical protein CV087_22705 [Candidatus Brocadia sp. WS118]
MKISKRGIELIKKFEGLELKPYKDSAGHMTIGYGHLIRRGETFYEINEEMAEQLLMRDIEDVEKQIAKHVKVPLNQNQYDALVSWLFNIGIDAALKGTVIKKLNEGKYYDAAFTLKRYNKATVGGKLLWISGLANRRNAEYKLFNEEVKTA